MKSFLILGLLMSSFVARAEMMECASGHEKRNLEVAVVDQGCELKYTKSGATEVKATQKVGNTKCVEIRDRIQKTLEGAGYTCSEAK